MTGIARSVTLRGASPSRTALITAAGAPMERTGAEPHAGFPGAAACAVLALALAAPATAWETIMESQKRALAEQLTDQSRAADAGRLHAARAYERGATLRERGIVHERRALSADSEGARRAHRARARREFEEAQARFQEAIAHRDDMFLAYAGLGDVALRMGRYEAALEACEQSLAINFESLDALRCRGEALLGLDRPLAARDAYLELTHSGGGAQAAALMHAMVRWVEDRRRDPGGVEPATIGTFAAWLHAVGAFAI